jgi:LAO/AO transport system kinase
MSQPVQPAARPTDPEALLDGARAGDKAALGRLLSLVERGGPPARRVAELAFAPSAAVRHVIGITGAPGAGKSTLTHCLIGAARAEGQVGVLAIDPSSPYSGGAILGDRIRMQGHALDEGVFIRSMASRGHHGGLALAAPEAIRVLAAAGLPVVLVETVGVGQVEVEIVGAADTTIVVVTPGWGDAIQASKAGLLEVADIFVVNKADRAGADETRRDLEAMLDLAAGDETAWRPPVLMTVAATGQGTDEVWATIRRHRDHLAASGELDRRRERRLVDELDQVLVHLLERDVRALAGGERYERVKAEMVARRVDPHQAARQILSP